MLARDLWEWEAAGEHHERRPRGADARDELVQLAVIDPAVVRIALIVLEHFDLERIHGEEPVAGFVLELADIWE